MEKVFTSRKPYLIKSIPLNIKVVKIVCGALHNLVLTEKGEVFSWGNNDSGQLGREGNEL